MIFGYKNRLSATVLVNTISSDMFIKNFKDRNFIDNIDDLDILMLSRYFTHAVQREERQGILYSEYVIKFSDVFSALKEHGKDSFDYLSATRLNSGIKNMSKDQLVDLLTTLKETSSYQHNIHDLKEYLGSEF